MGCVFWRGVSLDFDGQKLVVDIAEPPLYITGLRTSANATPPHMMATHHSGG